MKAEGFYLGTHLTHWLGILDVPLFISNRPLRKRKSLPKALNRWALDSGGFTELTLNGRWTVTPEQYVSDIRRYRQEIGNLEWCAIQDWMCEPIVREQTKLSVWEHQAKTVDSFLELKSLDDTIPFIPILQGWERDDYFRHIEMYQSVGIELTDYDVVGLGSVCRRQNTYDIQELVRTLYSQGLKLHGFGVKKQGLKQIAECLVSADSLAWSYSARYGEGIAGHTHKNCANCLEYAVIWRDKLVEELNLERQWRLFY